MSEQPKSSGEQHIEGLMQQLDPSSERYQVLATARKFKSSWVELGEQLLKVSSHRLFQEWGFASFEDYCAKEVRIKQPTAQKLTLAYRYLEKEEPQLLARQAEFKPPPDYRCVDLLRQAREEQGVSEEDFQRLRQAVIEEDRSHPTALKRFKEIVPASSASPTEGQRLKAGLGAARRLQTALQEIPELPPEFLPPLQELLAFLEARLEEQSATPDPG
jgi:hypothetical protein